MQTSEYVCALIVRLSGTLAAYRTVPVELLNSGWNMKMKYMISWNERPQGSPMEYENAQRRILEVFSPWKAPNDFKIESFVIREGDWGGYMLMDCEDPLEVHKFCSMLPAFEFQARPLYSCG